MFEPEPKAEVEKTTVPRRWRAYCETHQDGWNGTKRTAEKWAAKHNAEHHKETHVEPDA
ncbi:hypothetical protein HYQ19_gp064 [Arthrobacter phage DrYang]|uniref:Uncharacterized protein n=1 Tax=Arthrobacter phage DrYang TaxID=2686080 RepID=A0A6B9JC02_9CAUD|nr:hypothetical protein HYQ19_gp064 [Arthrobacter phage DrYang]QGZ17163.1 hypothetical protein SEA_DRYANG_64 [Arthrobacter phage DrYang]